MSEMGQGTKRKKYNIKLSMLMIGFQSPGIILWSRDSIGGLSCFGGGMHSLSALVVYELRFIYRQQHNVHEWAK